MKTIREMWERSYGEGTKFDLDYGKIIIIGLCVYIAIQVSWKNTMTKATPTGLNNTKLKIGNQNKCKFFLATGKNEEEQKILGEIYNSKFKEKCYPLDNLTIAETLPIIKNCNISICNDTGFAHLSSALGVKTITLMADTPLIYGSYSSNMYPIIPDGETTVTHDTLGKDKINPEKIFKKFISLIN